ncbi:sugar ABC transporter substrate-binding protein [Mycobacterium sp. M26]|uniref:ABC transporter substrate-binding protein n=1 Tax=Mycobacterium sp. M26 TaxID=1762962 RepID=UPI00073E3CD6|nr:sugar ABC transporter substrate-binding protein [Mycobacterium sp. M26]
MKLTTPGLRRAATALGALGASALLLAGCAGSGGPDTATATGSGQVPTDTSGTVNILMENVPDTDIVKSLIPEFNKKYPNIKVTIEPQTYDQIRDKLVASFQAPKATYDLVVVDNVWMKDFVAANWLQPLDSRIDSTPDYDYADFFKPLTDIDTVDGKRYAVPFYNYALGYIYNVPDYEKAGLTPPTSLDELIANSKKLVQGDRAGIAMQPQRGYKVFEEWANFLFAAGGTIYDDAGNYTLDTPEAKRALAAYVDLYNTAAPKNSLNWGFDEAGRSVSSGQAASLVSYNWNLPSLNAPDGTAAKSGVGPFKLAAMPGGVDVLGSWSWAIPSNSGNADAAWAFASWLTSKPIDVERVVKGGAVIRTSSTEDQKVLKDGFGADYYAVVKDILSKAKPLSNQTNAEEMIQAVGTELNEAVAGTKSIDDALRDAQAAAEKTRG